jgi:maleate isomerase
MYGWRGRIGLMVPTGNSVMEPEFQRMAPEGVTTHANRVELKDVTPASLLEMEGDAARSARQIAQTRVGVIAFGCTSGSFVGGPGYDDRLIRIIEGETGVRATTTTTAVIRALNAFGISRIALATPYTNEVTKLEVDYLQASGFEVTNWQGGGIVVPPRPRGRQ